LTWFLLAAVAYIYRRIAPDVKQISKCSFAAAARPRNSSRVEKNGVKREKLDQYINNGTNIRWDVVSTCG